MMDVRKYIPPRVVIAAVELSALSAAMTEAWSAVNGWSALTGSRSPTDKPRTDRKTNKSPMAKLPLLFFTVEPKVVGPASRIRSGASTKTGSDVTGSSSANCEVHHHKKRG
jgi:hypothetical protein